MPELQTGDVARKLQERYALLGPPPSPFLSPELVPVVVVDDLTGQDVLSAEFERLYTLDQVAAGNVTNIARIKLINPPDSGVLLATDRWWVYSANAFILQVSNVLSTLSPATPGWPRDTRVVGRAACGTSTALAGSPSSRGFNIEIAAGVSTLFEVPYVIQPNWELRFDMDTVNLAFRLNIHWRERTL